MRWRSFYLRPSSNLTTTLNRTSCLANIILRRIPLLVHRSRLITVDPLSLLADVNKDLQSSFNDIARSVEKGGLRRHSPPPRHTLRHASKPKNIISGHTTIICHQLKFYVISESKRQENATCDYHPGASYASKVV